MKPLAAFALAGIFACSAPATGGPAPPPPPPPPAETEPEPEPDVELDSVSADGLYSCRKLRSGKVSINFRAGYSPADVAAWLMGWSCRTVVLSRSYHDRRSKAGYSNLVEARQLPEVLVEMLAQLDLVALSQGSVTVFLDADERLADGKPGLVWTPRAPPARATAAADISAGITKIGEGTYRIKRATFDRIVKDGAMLGRGARIIPSIKNGKPNGFKLYAIRPSSVYAKLGVMNGDTIHALNGNQLTTPDQALDVYDDVIKATTIVVDITRRGKPATLTYVVE